MALSWLRRQRERAARVNADAGMFVRELGHDAYAEARLMQRRAKSVDERRHWRDVALSVARKTGKRVGLDTATRMSLDADFSERGEPQSPGIEPLKVDPIDELKRLIRGRA
jgi:hypothetical protein